MEEENPKRKSISDTTTSKESAKGSKKAKVDESEIEIGHKNVRVNNLNVPRALSPELGLFVSASAMGRTDISSMIWTYVKRNNLQDVSDKRTFTLDNTLQAIFGSDVKSLNMFELSTHLKKHIIVPKAPEGKVSKKYKRVPLQEKVRFLMIQIQREVTISHLLMNGAYAITAIKRSNG